MSFKPSSQAAAQAYRPAFHRLIDLLREELHGEESSSRGEDHVMPLPWNGLFSSQKPAAAAPRGGSGSIT